MRLVQRPPAPTCFHESDPSMPLGRRSAVECVGTLLLMLAATNAGLVARRLGAGEPELALLCSALATSGALVGLIVAFGNASGGHFNPLITALQWLAGERSIRCTLAYIAAQFSGGLLGALLANVAFAASAVTAAPAAASASVVLSEGIATAGLMIVIFGCSRSGLAKSGPFAVGVWLTAAIVATPSGSYANPVITVAATWVGGSIALPSHVAMFYLPAEIAGALVALAVITMAYPHVVPAPTPDPGPPDLGPPGRQPDDPDGLVTHASRLDAASTTDRLAAAITRHGMAIMARIDHAAAARDADLALRHTELLIFGNPRAGTPLMQASQRVGIDLPLKALVWSDAAGRTWVSHQDPRWLVRHHGVEQATMAQAEAMTAAMARLMDDVIGAGPDHRS